MTKDMIILLAVHTGGALVVLIFWLGGRLRKASQRQHTAEKRLSTIEQQLLAAKEPSVVSSAAAELPQETSFAGSLKQADLRMRLQQGQKYSVKIIERYRLMAAMARQGLVADDISAILRLSRSETEQLLKLTHLTQQTI